MIKHIIDSQEAFSLSELPEKSPDSYLNQTLHFCLTVCPTCFTSWIEPGFLGMNVTWKLGYLAPLVLFLALTWFPSTTRDFWLVSPNSNTISWFPSVVSKYQLLLLEDTNIQKTQILILVQQLIKWASLIGQLVKNLPAMQETQVQFLGQEDLLEKG